MKILPMVKKRVVFIDEESVVKLLLKFLSQRFQTGKIDNELIFIKAVRAKPECKASAIAVHESAVPIVPPLTVTAGKPIEMFNGLMHGNIPFLHLTQYHACRQAVKVFAAALGRLPAANKLKKISQ
jgi:hypothetical protein